MQQTKVHSDHLTNSRNPQFMRTRAASENETCLSTTLHFARCDSLSPHFSSTSVHSVLLNFRLFYFAVTVGYCVPALPLLGHSFLDESQDFPVGAHIILLSLCVHGGHVPGGIFLLEMCLQGILTKLCF